MQHSFPDNGELRSVKPETAIEVFARRVAVVFAAATISLVMMRPAICEEGAPRRLRVLTYNIHHGEGMDGNIDLHRIAGVIREANPDLVALQEVDDRTQRSGGVDQTAELARLTGLFGRFGKQIDYEGGGYGQAILSRFPIRELKVHWLPGHPDRERRIAVEALIRVVGQDHSFVSTHLHHQNNSFREQQVVSINALFATSDRPTILAGDLNADPDSAPLSTLSPAWSRPSLVTATYPSAAPVKQIDYVLYRPDAELRAIHTEVLDQPVASDHRPLLVILELADSEQ